ncbi:MAG TPA: hypothetical protein VFW24_18690 [Acidimicrobiales bacterium]|nr:hypothetical protein [Acidimicrobiales bacterium]
MEAVRLVVDELHPYPHQVFSLLRQAGPVARLDGPSGVEAYVVSSWDLVAQAAARVEDFSNHFRYVLFRRDDGTLGAMETGPTGPDVFAGEDPPAHSRHRRIFRDVLANSRVQALEPCIAGTLFSGRRRRARWGMGS